MVSNIYQNLSFDCCDRHCVRETIFGRKLILKIGKWTLLQKGNKDSIFCSPAWPGIWKYNFLSSLRHSISLIADHRKCCAQGMMGRLRVNTALFNWLLFTLSGPIILSTRHFRRSAIRLMILYHFCMV